ncbi:uncharacterized protein Nmag_2399 [Natrialba magadii ATCC 43099]|uniref:PD-(D/E)XK endonuclease-like domain-containing protein n=1 Tax=Natrialba magadii (strain ATCC 43099 / DSM 3394 / CCM 3739 / CIP 104546 / IAM 13178 / JCM 8861 / NBRC 102185 / NCIMB 2190 / MS3) TaxID=547559 RepID=D3SXL1_NATMM|nr:hypothetical protein [Natrialba magadii]ADD05960.1 uncharacterized protein Nmag_2399 [Natrialba magadii ATCC 43099]ELY30532.1 hypothetical protein C500_08422 [Natrialba magadii ATCC 43099]
MTPPSAVESETDDELAAQADQTVVTADALATHIVCPRQYEFAFERPLSARETSTDRVRDRRRQLLRRSIIAGLRSEADSEEGRVEAALEWLDHEWRQASAGDRQPYIADAQEQYDADALAAAVETYFSNGGHEHAERLVEADTVVGYERDGVRYEATVDAVVERDRGYLAIRYVPTLHGVLQVSWSDTHVREFMDGQSYYPRQIGSFVRAGVAIRGLKAEYGFDLPCDFAYVAPLAESRPVYESESGVRVEVEQRHFEDAFEEETRDLVDLIEERAAAIRDGKTDPRAWRFAKITDSACEYCAYRDACPDRMGAELAFIDREPTRGERGGRGEIDD